MNLNLLGDVGVAGSSKLVDLVYLKSRSDLLKFYLPN